jgi:hypothetical protein
MLPGHLDLEDHQIPKAEAGLTTCQVKLPHAGEALAQTLDYLFATDVPFIGRLGVWHNILKLFLFSSIL